jgi:hypothetical protein
MKNYILLAALLLTGCGANLPDQFENIEMLRSLAITFDNHGYAEAAPGDTVCMRAYFSGDQVNSAQWWVSTQLISGIFGADTFVDSIPIQQLMIPGTYNEDFGGKTDSISLNFKVPEDVIRNQFDLSKPVSSLLPSGINDSARQALSSLTIGQVFGLLDMTSTTGTINPAMLGSMYGGMLNKQNLSLILQTFSIKIQIAGIVNGYYKLKTFLTVKYNTRMKKIGIDVEVNRIPVIENVRLYKVAGDNSSFDPQGEKVSVVYVLTDQRSDTILIEKGYSYFLKAEEIDSLADYGYTYNDTTYKKEYLVHKWFYRNDDEVSGTAMDNLMKIGLPTFDSNTVKLYPALDKRMKNFSIWLAVYDEIFGVRFRPRGFAFKAMHGVFRYAEGY